MSELSEARVLYAIVTGARDQLDRARSESRDRYLSPLLHGAADNVDDALDHLRLRICRLEAQRLKEIHAHSDNPHG